MYISDKRNAIVGREESDDSSNYIMIQLENPWSQGGSLYYFYLSLVVGFYRIKKYYPSQPKIQPN